MYGLVHHQIFDGFNDFPSVFFFFQEENDMLNALINPTIWQEFLEYKCEHGHMNKKELQLWEQFISQKDYLPIGQAILQGGTFLPPRKSEISKMHSQKKADRIHLFRYRKSSSEAADLLAAAKIRPAICPQFIFLPSS